MWESNEYFGGIEYMLLKTGIILAGFLWGLENQSYKPELRTRVTNQSCGPELQTRVTDQSYKPELRTRVTNQSYGPELRTSFPELRTSFPELIGRLSYYNLRPNLRPRLHPNHFRRWIFAKVFFPDRLNKVVGRRLGRRLY